MPQRVESAARVDDPATNSAAAEPAPPALHATNDVSSSSPSPQADREARDPRLYALAEQILDELRRSKEQPVQDFSVSKMLAGICQVMTLAVLFLAYLNRSDPVVLNNTLLFALTMQTMTIALLIMSRGR
jgi:hypothetical protein